MKTKVDSTHISNMNNKQETHIDRDHNPVLCLLPLSSTIPSPQRNCLRPPGHPCPRRPSSTSSIWARCPREHRDDRESKWKSNILNITIRPVAESNQRMEEANDFALWSDQIRSAQAEVSAADEGAELELRQHQRRTCSFNTRTRSLIEANRG